MLKWNANWCAPNNIYAFTTLRYPGFSQYPFNENNLAYHVGDQADKVALNRQQLCVHLPRQQEPIWLQQTHSIHCIIADVEQGRIGDAVVTRQAYTPLAILTADCFPILLCNHAGTEIAAIHAGWRGLFNGIIENTLHKMASKADELIAWVGPGICQSCFQINEDLVRLYQDCYFSNNAFYKMNKKCYANLAQVAEFILIHAGVKLIYQANVCTYEQEKHFYSYRRNVQTGRMATLIWFVEKNYD